MTKTQKIADFDNNAKNVENFNLNSHFRFRNINLIAFV